MTLVCNNCGFKTEDPNMKECPSCKVALAEEVAPDKSPEQQEMDALASGMKEIEEKEAELEAEDEAEESVDDEDEMEELEEEAENIELDEEKVEEELGDAKAHKHANMRVREVEDLVGGSLDVEEPEVKSKPEEKKDEEKKKSLVQEL